MRHFTNIQLCKNCLEFDYFLLEFIYVFLWNIIFHNNTDINWSIIILELFFIVKLLIYKRKIIWYQKRVVWRCQYHLLNAEN